LETPEALQLAAAAASGVYHAGAAVVGAVGDGVTGIAEWSDERKRQAAAAGDAEQRRLRAMQLLACPGPLHAASWAFQRPPTFVIFSIIVNRHSIYRCT
jgi:class 3 adenylate cyclase